MRWWVRWTWGNQSKEGFIQLVWLRTQPPGFCLYDLRKGVEQWVPWITVPFYTAQSCVALPSPAQVLRFHTVISVPQEISFLCFSAEESFKIKPSVTFQGLGENNCGGEHCVGSADGRGETGPPFSGQKLFLWHRCEWSFWQFRLEPSLSTTFVFYSLDEARLL